MWAWGVFELYGWLSDWVLDKWHGLNPNTHYKHAVCLTQFGQNVDWVSFGKTLFHILSNHFLIQKDNFIISDLKGGVF